MCLSIQCIVGVPRDQRVTKRDKCRKIGRARIRVITEISRNIAVTTRYQVNQRDNRPIFLYECFHSFTLVLV